MGVAPASGALVLSAGISGLAMLLAFAFVRLGHSRVPGTDGAGLRFSGFNALRAFAALGVLASHTLTTSPVPGLPGSVAGDLATGVTLFFVISGFLLYRPFAASLEHPDRISIVRFLENRGLRILPLYMVVVIVVVLATRDQSISSLLMALTFTGVYSGQDLLPVSWSLDDEVFFYLVLPPLYLIILRWRRPSQRLAVGAVVIAVLCLVSLAMLGVRPADQSITGGPFTKFHLFGFGMLLASLHASQRRPRLDGLRLVLVALAVVPALVLAGMAFDEHLYIFSPLSGLAFSMVVGVVGFSDPAGPLSRVLTWRPLVHIGDASFGIYLWHEPLHHVLYNLGALPSGYFPSTIELACCAIALATGTYYLVEKPTLSMKRRWAAQPARPGSASLRTIVAPLPAS